MAILTSYDLRDPANIDNFTRTGVAGYSNFGEDPFQREAPDDVLRDEHYVSGVSCVLLEDTPTQCALIAPANVSATPDGLDFDVAFNAVVGSVDHYEWRLDDTGSWTSIGLSLSFSGTTTAGTHVANVRAVTPGGVAGATADSNEFEAESSNTLLNNLAAYWNMNDAANASASDQVGTETLTQNNGVGSTTGKVGNCRTFAVASSQYFSHVDDTVLSVSGDFTFAFWFYLSSDQAGSGFIEKENEYKMMKNASDNVVFLVFDSVSGSSSAVNIGDAVAPGTWYFYCGWYDSLDMKAHVQINNGTVYDAATALSNGPKDGAGNFYMGIDTAVGWYDGRLDEVGFWKRKLTDEEKAILYNSGAGTTYPFT